MGTSADYTRALSDRMRALDAVLSATPDYFHLYDRGGRFLYVSPLTLQALGRTDDEVIGRTWRELGLPTAVGEDFDRRLATVLATGQAHTGEIALTSEFGPRQLEESLSPVRDATGQIVVVVSTVRDVTERHQATERLAVLSEITSALASSLDLQTTLTSVARLVVPSLADYCLIDLLGEGETIERVVVAHRDPVKQPLVEALRRYPPDLANAISPTARTLRAGQTVMMSVISPEEIAAVARDDEHLQIIQALAPGSVITAPLRAREHNLGCLVLVMAESDRRYGPTERDLAEDVARRAALAIDNARLYEAEQRARAEAQAAVRLREEFLGIASHELKTPLTIIKGYVQLLNRRAGQRDLSPDRLASIYDALGRQIQRLEVLVSNLLDTARVQQGRLVLERRPADLVEIARQVVARFADAPERTEHHHLTLAATEPVEGVWDTDRLDQVLTNLISNALKYSPAGGEVRVALRQADDEAEVTISDQGLGIPADEQTRLFQPFYRGASHLAHGIPGVGLGLYISGRIIDRHGGRIAVVSAPGAGTTFTIRLPSRGRPTAIGRRP